MRRKENVFVDFIDLERQSLLPTYPNDQNHVVRRKKYFVSWIDFISLKKVLRRDKKQQRHRRTK